MKNKMKIFSAILLSIIFLGSAYAEISVQSSNNPTWIKISKKYGAFFTLYDTQKPPDEKVIKTIKISIMTMQTTAKKSGLPMKTIMMTQKDFTNLVLGMIAVGGVRTDDYDTDIIEISYDDVKKAKPKGSYIKRLYTKKINKGKVTHIYYLEKKSVTFSDDEFKIFLKACSGIITRK